MARRETVHGRPAVLFAIAFALLIVVLALLGHYGLPDRVMATTLGGAALIAIAATGLSGSTMQASEFYVAGRTWPAPLNGIASAAAAISSLLFLGLAGSYFRDNGGAAITIGWALGFLILTVGVAPYFRKSAAFGIVDFLGIRYGGRAVRVVAAVVVAAALFAVLAAAIAGAVMVTATVFDLSDGAALAVVTAVVLAGTVLGGLTAVTRSAVVEYAVMAMAFVVPVAIVSLREFSLPVPFLTFGLASKEAALLALASGNQLAAPLAGNFSTAASSGFAAFATAVTLAAGVAALPHLILRSAAVRGPDRARRSAAWALLAVLLIALTAPAYPAFARLIILREVVDGPIGSLPGWIFAFGHLGFVRICGISATSAEAVLSACQSLPGFSGTLRAADLAISGDAIVLVGPSIFGLPYVNTALVAVGALAATLAAAKASAHALASALGHDLYGGAIDTHASAGRQLIVTRLIGAAAILLAAWVAARAAGGAITLAPIALSLSAGGLFPALILAIWWRRANAAGAIAGIVVGGALTTMFIAEHHLPGFLPFGVLGLDNLTGAIVGMPFGFLAVVSGSFATDPPSDERLAIVDAIRRPGGTPFVQESESP